MAFYELTNDELRGVLDWLNDEQGNVPPPEAASKLITISARLQKKLLDEALRSRREAAGYRKRIERITERKDRAVAAGEFRELGFDSVEVARCLLCYVQELGVHCSKNKLMYLMYIAYASWLASKDERLCIEQPVATEWGPNFWRVYKHIPNTFVPTSFQDVKAVAEVNSGVAAFLRNVVRKYGDLRDADLERYVKGSPYKAALPEHNDGKWNGLIRDTLIYEWKKQETDR